MAANRLQVTPGLQMTLENRTQASLGPRNQLGKPARQLRKLLRTFAAAALAMSFPAVALGQTGFGQTGTGFGQAGLGQTGFGQAGVGQTGTGQAGGLGLGDALTSGLGQSGQNGFGANPFGVGGLSGQALSPYGRNGLIGATTTGGGTAGAAGANTGGALGAANNLGGLTGAALNNRSLQSTLGGFGGRNSRGGLNQNQNQNSKSTVRATVSLGFEVAPPTNAVATQTINDRLRRIPSSVLNGVTVEINGRTATIRGQVNAPSDGKVIERLLSLEPGIDAVKNELTYANGQAPAMPMSATSSSTPLQPSVGKSAVQVAPEVVPAPNPR